MPVWSPSPGMDVQITCTSLSMSMTTVPAAQQKAQSSGVAAQARQFREVRFAASTSRASSKASPNARPQGVPELFALNGNTTGYDPHVKFVRQHLRAGSVSPHRQAIHHHQQSLLPLHTLLPLGFSKKCS